MAALIAGTGYMPNSPKSSPEVFAKQVERLIAPLFAECFTKETRRVRDLLLLTSFILMLLILGVVHVDATSRKYFGITVTVIYGVRWVLAAVCVYFLSSLCARSYIEWNFWRVTHQSPLLELSRLHAEITASLAAQNSRFTSAFTSTAELGQKLALLGEDSPTVVQLKKELREADQHSQRLANQSKAEWDALQAKGGGTLEERTAFENGILFQSHKVSERILELTERIGRERASQRERTATERATLEGRLSESDKAFRQHADDPRRGFLNAKLYYLHDTLNPAKTTFRIRFLFEMAFPIIFGVMAIVLSFAIL
jgi:hypothetical protein